MTCIFNKKVFYTYLKIGTAIVTTGFILLLAYLRAHTNIPIVEIMPKSEQPFRRYSPPKIASKPEYKLVLLGDSMTAALGPHGGIFNETLNNLYEKNNTFVDIYNYARASTSVLSLEEAISTQTKAYDFIFEPLLSRDVDLILIESFGYNPLSQYTREQGLHRQTMELNKIMKILTNSRPNAAIVFFATIAPSKSNYSRTTQFGKSSAERMDQAQERIVFIQNHINYANKHGISVINIFEKSLKNGDGNLEYINPDDFIHPSAVGINFISDELSRYIYDNEILPH